MRDFGSAELVKRGLALNAQSGPPDRELSVHGTEFGAAIMSLSKPGSRIKLRVFTSALFCAVCLAGALFLAVRIRSLSFWRSTVVKLTILGR